MKKSTVNHFARKRRGGGVNEKKKHWLLLESVRPRRLRSITVSQYLHTLQFLLSEI